MPDISVDAFSVAVVNSPNYVPVTVFGADLPAQVRIAVESGHVPVEYLAVLSPDETDGPDVSALALAALGVPAHDQPLFLVRSGPLRDPLVAALAQLVHEAGWAGEELGITFLEELGGTAIFDLLDWALPDDSGGTVLICDEPLCVDARRGPARFTAVGLRVRHGSGPLRVLASGEGEPGTWLNSVRTRFIGTGPCDSWLALHAALAAGEIGDGDRILLQTRTPAREGWLALHLVDPAGLRLVAAPAGVAGAGRCVVAEPVDSAERV